MVSVTYQHRYIHLIINNIIYNNLHLPSAFIVLGFFVIIHNNNKLNKVQLFKLLLLKKIENRVIINNVYNLPI